VNAFRRHIHRHCWWAAALIVAALFIEILVPAGYMPTMTNGAFLMRPCAGRNAPIAMTAVADAPDHAMHGDHKTNSEDDDPGKLEMPCVFSSLSAPGLTIDPVLLAIAIAFILATTFRVEQRLVPWRRIYLRPPSQGPPATT